MRIAFALALLTLGGCSTLPLEFAMDPMPPTDMSVPAVEASVETVAVPSTGDAADDPAIFVVGDDAIILGTDKQAGLFVYALDGSVKQFLAVGRVNNVDLRHVAEDMAIAVASNRSTNTVNVFAVSLAKVAELGSFPAIRDEPYGICMGALSNGYAIAVTHKGGEVDMYRMDQNDPNAADIVQTTLLGTQLEGCAFDEANGAFFVGREEQGVYRFDLDLATGELANETEIDRIGGPTGITNDIEGIAIYDAGNGEGYLVASSQGNNTYAVYDRPSREYLGRFRIADHPAAGIDGAEETDGLDVTSASLPGYPRGFLVVQDGFNMPRGEAQNFKIIDWRAVEEALRLSATNTD